MKGMEPDESSHENGLRHAIPLALGGALLGVAAYATRSAAGPLRRWLLRRLAMLR